MTNQQRNETRSAYGTDEVEAVTPDHQKVHLKLNKLRLFSNGNFSNVYRGKIVDGNEDDPPSIAVKKTWVKANSDMVEARIFGRLHRHKHKNILQLLYMFENVHAERSCYGLIFEFLPANLYSYIRDMAKAKDRRPDMVEIKLLTWQLFRGQAHLAAQKILHRDIKPQNILVNPDTGLLKIGDFGSSKFWHAGEVSHHYNVTRYFRAPELILGSRLYGPEIDVWSCGCVLGELLRGSVMWPGTTTNHQLYLICQTIGKPTYEDITAMKVSNEALLNSDGIQDYYKLFTDARRGFIKVLPLAPLDAIDIMIRILKFNPQQRLWGVALLKDPWFAELFNPETRRSNDKPITILNRGDYAAAIAGDITPGATIESRTGSVQTSDL